MAPTSAHLQTAKRFGSTSTPVRAQAKTSFHQPDRQVLETRGRTAHINIRDKVTQRDIGGEAFRRTQIGRSTPVFSIEAKISKTNSTTDRFLLSQNQFFSSSGNLQTRDTVDERKQASDQPLVLGAYLTYTSPLWSRATLATSYAWTSTSDVSLQETFNREDGKYQTMVDSLSSNFQIQTVSQQGSINLEEKTSRFSFTVGGDWLSYNYRQNDQLEKSTQHQSYTNWSPRITCRS